MKMKRFWGFLSLMMAVSLSFGALTWCGDSYIIINGTWYNGSGTGNPPSFNGANLSTLTVLNLGGELQSWDGSGDVARLHYMIDSNSPQYVNLPLVGEPWNDIWLEAGVELDLSGLSEGAHTLAVWFEVIDNEGGPSSVWDSNNSSNYIATFSIPEGALPISLASFTAAALNGVVSVTWVTESESENSHFLVYRDGEVIGRVAGAGTTTEPQSYTFVDKTAVPGVHAYAISDVTFGGEEVLHAAVAVELPSLPQGFGEHFALGAAYPNPFNPRTVIGLQYATGSNTVITIYNTQGVLVEELINGYLEAGNYDLAWDATGMPSGVYIVHMLAGDVMRSQKIVLMK